MRSGLLHAPVEGHGHTRSCCTLHSWQKSSYEVSNDRTHVDARYARLHKKGVFSIRSNSDSHHGLARFAVVTNWPRTVSATVAKNSLPLQTVRYSEVSMPMTSKLSVCTLKPIQSILSPLMPIHSLAYSTFVDSCVYSTVSAISCFVVTCGLQSGMTPRPGSSQVLVYSSDTKPTCLCSTSWKMT